MKTEADMTEVSIHRRARDMDLIDQTAILADDLTFRAVLDWMDAPLSAKEIKGMERLHDAHRRLAAN